MWFKQDNISLPEEVHSPSSAFCKEGRSWKDTGACFIQQQLYSLYVCVLPLAPPTPTSSKGICSKRATGTTYMHPPGQPGNPAPALPPGCEPQTDSVHPTFPLFHGQRYKLVCVYNNCVLTAGCRADRQSSPNGKHYLWPSSPSQRQGSVYCRQHNSRWYQRACQRSTIIRSHFN